MEFIKYPKIRPLKAVENMGIFDSGDIYIFEKIDGSNAQIRKINGEIVVGRRNDFVDEGESSFSELILWAKEHKPLSGLSEDYIIFGEWLKPHTIKYPSDNYNKFYAFDIYSIKDQLFLPYKKCVPIYDSLEITYLKPWYVGEYQSREHIDSFIGKTDFGADKGEGVVIKNYGFINCFGRQSYAKVVSEEFKEDKHKQIFDESKKEQKNKEKEIVEKIITPARMQKIYQKGKNGEIDIEFCGDMRDMAWLPSYVVEDAIEENSDLLKAIFSEVDLKSIRKLATPIVAAFLKGLVR